MLIQPNKYLERKTRHGRRFTKDTCLGSKELKMMRMRRNLGVTMTSTQNAKHATAERVMVSRKLTEETLYKTHVLEIHRMQDDDETKTGV